MHAFWLNRSMTTPVQHLHTPKEQVHGRDSSEDDEVEEFVTGTAAVVEATVT